MGGLVGRLVVFAILGGVVCGSAVVFVFGLGFQVRHAWYALIPFALGSVALVVLRFFIPSTDADASST